MIGAALGNGAQDPSTEDSPDFLKAFGIKEYIEQFITENTAENFQEISWDTILYPHFTKKFNKALPIVSEFSERLQKVVGRVLSNGDFPIVLGGDHSCAIGTWSGVSRTFQHYGQDNFGLLWVDAHMDSHTFETTPSNAIHGMPLATLLGYGKIELTNIAYSGPKIKPENLVLVGIRAYESGEKELLDRLGVTYFTTEDIENEGLNSVLEKAKRIVSKNNQYWGMSIDIDAFDPIEAPGVGSREQQGICVKDFSHIINQWQLSSIPEFRILEIAEFSPNNDINDQTAKIVQELIVQILIK
jgi:arginase